MPLLQRDAGPLYYELEGNGPPVLFIQGIGVTGEGWRPQVADLARDHATLFFDNRGIGRSQPCTGEITIEAMAADALALMDAAGWRSAHVVGHSMGGVIAQQLAFDAPSRVRSLSLWCTFARGKEGARPTPRVIWLSLRSRLGTRAMRRRAFLDMLFPREFLRAADLAALAARTGAIVGRDLADSPAIMMKQLGALGRHDGAARLAELKSIPALVVSGRHDPIALPRFGRQLAELLPRARYEEFADAAHGVTIQEPVRVNARLRAFIRETEAKVR